MAKKRVPKTRADSRNVFFIGLTSLFNDASSEMILPFLPLFLVNVLGVGKEVVGLIEGIADSTSSLFKLLSGWLSDKFNSRKPLITLGYVITNVTKPFLSIANSWPLVLVIRFSDRLGKGIRTAPRDALIAASSTKETQGRSFGIYRMMDSAGTVVGVVTATILFYFLSMSIQTIFLLTAIPGALAVITVVLFVKDKKVTLPKKGPVKLSLKPFGRRFKRYIVVNVLFTLGNFSYAFLILRAQDIGMAIAMIPMVYLFYNALSTAIAVPAGRFADRIGKMKMLAASFFLFGLISFGFGFTSGVAVSVILFALYGVFLTLNDISARAVIPEMSKEENRGTAYGIYHTSVGLAAFPASFIAGSLWQFVSVEAAFGLAAGLSLVSGVLLLFWVKD